MQLASSTNLNTRVACLAFLVMENRCCGSGAAVNRVSNSIVVIIPPAITEGYIKKDQTFETIWNFITAMVDCKRYLKVRSDDRAVKLIQHALQLSLPALYKDPRELASQLVGGRLSMRYDEKQTPEILQVVEQAKQYRPSDGDGAQVPVY